MLLLDSPLLLGERLTQHGQLSFRGSDGLFVILNAYTDQTEGGLGFLDLLVDGAHIARKLMEFSDNATTNSRRISATKFTYFFIVDFMNFVYNYAVLNSTQSLGLFSKSCFWG